MGCARSARPRGDSDGHPQRVPIPPRWYAASKARRSPRSAVAAVAVVVVLGLGACGSSNKGTATIDASSDAAGGCTAGGTAAGTPGETCGCDRDCQSGFCVDGVCCNTACTGDLQGLQRPGLAGNLHAVPAGGAPRDADRLPDTADASSCGLDGTCDGTGACRQHVAGTICKPGACDGAPSSASTSATALGRCKPGPATICAPFNCDPATGACFEHLPVRRRLRPRHAVRERKLRAQAAGAMCSKDGDCASGLLRRRRLLQRRLPRRVRQLQPDGRAGTCWPVDPGAPIRTAVPATRGRPRAGRRAPATASAAARSTRPRRSASRRRAAATGCNTAGTCDGIGTCRPPGVQSCAPYRCTDGACIARCTGDADCVSRPGLRQSGSCGPKPNGQPCAAAGECISNFCVDGVCCDEACARRLPQLRAAVVDGPLRAGRRRAPPIRATSAWTRARRPAAPTASATAPAAAGSTRRARSARPRAARQRLHAALDVQRDAARAWRPTRCPARRSSATAARCFNACTTTPTACAGKCAPTTRAGSS